jgi:hypothetical protein
LHYYLLFFCDTTLALLSWVYIVNLCEVVPCLYRQSLLFNIVDSFAASSFKKKRFRLMLHCLCHVQVYVYLLFQHKFLNYKGAVKLGQSDFFFGLKKAK